MPHYQCQAAMSWKEELDGRGRLKGNKEFTVSLQDAASKSFGQEWNITACQPTLEVAVLKKSSLNLIGHEGASNGTYLREEKIRFGHF